MSPRMHLELDSADPFERGRQRGAQVAGRLRETWPIYESLFAVTARDAGQDPVDISAVAHACLDALSPWSPELLRELEGVSAGSGLSLTTIMALNARTEVFAVAGGTNVTECSTVVELAGPTGSALSAQTWDWHAELADGWHVQTVRSGQSSYVGLSEFGMLAKIGVNSRGLGLHFNLLRHESDARGVVGDGPAAPVAGVPVHLLAAAVLSGAGTVSEAADLVRSAPIAASTVLTVLTADEAACIEMSPAGVGVVEPSDGWLVHANHFIDPQLAKGEAVTQYVTTTFEREDLLRSRAEAVGAPQDAEALSAMLCAHDEGAAVCRHAASDDPHGYRSATLATVALDVERRQARVSEDGPCRRTDVMVLVAED